MKILLIGALPPPIGGTTILFDMLVKDLRSDPDIKLEVTNLPSLKEAKLLKKLYTLFIFSIHIYRKTHKYDLISLHVSSQGFIFLGAMLSIICKIKGIPLIVRAFGGDLKNVYTAAPLIIKKIMSLSFQGSKVLLETKYLVHFFSNTFPNAEIEWYANSRPQHPVQEKQFNKGKMKFIYLGHVKKEKGVLDILEAAKSIHRDDYSIDIYGPLSDELNPSWLCGNGVSYKGVVEPDQIDITLRQYDMLIIPTYYEGEGYPGVILEAYGLSMPVIATSWMAIPEIVKDGVTGYLTPPKAPILLAKTIVKALNNRKGLSQLSVNSRKMYSAFTSDIWTRKYKSICEEVIHNYNYPLKSKQR